jgi:hypothetical protein
MLEGGWSNTIVGIDAGRGGGDDPYNYYGYVTERNTMLGCQAGYMLLNGNNNVFIGYQAGAAETGASNKLYIANSWGTALIYGDFSSGRIGLGTLAPGYKLDVVGDINISAGSNFKINGTNLSASTLGAEPALTKGNLTANSPISLSATQQVIGGAAVISISEATTSAKGAVQLSDSYIGTSQILATTEKALTDGLATKVTGSGFSTGKIFKTSTGNIVTTSKGFELNFDRTNSKIVINNTNKDYSCYYWYQSQSGAVSAGGSGSVFWNVPLEIVVEDHQGFEFHLSDYEGTCVCSVWIQFEHGRLMGHYTLY